MNVNSLKVVQNIGLVLYSLDQLEECCNWLRITIEQSQEHKNRECIGLSLLHLGLVLQERDELGVFRHTVEDLMLKALEASYHQWHRVYILTYYIQLLTNNNRLYEAYHYQQQLQSMSTYSGLDKFYHLNNHLIIPTYIQKY